jgi:hypothetical protein
MIAMLLVAKAKNILKSKILTRLYKITPSFVRLNTLTNAYINQRNLNFKIYIFEVDNPNT